MRVKACLLVALLGGCPKPASLDVAQGWGGMPMRSRARASRLQSLLLDTGVTPWPRSRGGPRRSAITALMTARRIARCAAEHHLQGSGGS